MNHSQEKTNAETMEASGITDHRGGRRGVGKKGAGSIAIVVLAALYTFLQPHLNQQLGWNLPGLGKATSNSSAGNADQKSKPAPEGPIANRKKPSSSNSNQVGNQAPSKENGDAKYGLLKEIGVDRYLSPQGLQYTPGSAEGHRLEHLRRHTTDQPTRPGSHGVFDGGMEGALKTIDQAYARAKKNQRTTKKSDKGRTIYTVDMGGRIGFVGGRDGNRKRKPMARRVRLVLEGTRVITAYPMN